MNISTSRPQSGLFGYMLPFLISLGFSILYVSMQTVSIWAGDSGKLVAAAYTWSIAHPPGYPFYMLLGGILTHTVPFHTVAWRMGLLSSLSMALSVYILWKTIFFITKSKMSASIGSILYGLLYPVWLYAMVPEVFGLFSLFSLLIVYVFLRYVETKKRQWFFLLAFLSGLSLTHHHLIILLLLSIGITLFFQKKSLVLSLKPYVLTILALFFFGFSFYLYAPIVSSRYPPFDWEHPASPIGFFRLITRASFGTFKASYGTGQSFLDRGLNLLTFFQYTLKDLGIISIGLFFIGLYGLGKKKRFIFFFFSVYVTLLLFFFFYAGFPVNSDFSLGTIERFFIVPYQTIALLTGVGVWCVLSFLKTLWKNHTPELHVPFWIIQVLIVSVAGTFFIRQFRINYPKLILLTNDRTLEKLADDIFTSVPQGGILNLQDDTSAFAVDYSYYVLKKRQDIRYMSFPMLQFSYYPSWMRHNFPDVRIPETPTKLVYKEYLQKFLRANYPDRPLLSERVDVSVPEHWVPRGLLVMYYPTLSDIPDRGQILEKNVALWQRFQDPFQGSLGTYKHLMMTDVLRYYADKRLTLAQAFLLYGKMDQAEREMNEAIRLYPNRSEVYFPFINLLVEQKKCEEAYEMAQKAEPHIMQTKDVVGLYHALYEKCRALQDRLRLQEEAYQDFMRKFSKPIE